MRKNQNKTLELRHTRPELKGQHRAPVADLIKQKEESVNLKRGYLKVSTQRSKKKEE